jgi:branched-chain amino acid transport system ATP-binding protein
MEVLRADKLLKNFGGVQAVNEVSFILEAGEKVAIIGPNGAGKTTLLNLLNGQLLPSSGRIFLFEKEITNMPTYLRARLGMARSFQLTTLFLGLSLLANLLLALEGTNSSRIKFLRPNTDDNNLTIKAEKFLKAMNLWEKKDTLVKKISYGEQRRLEILLCLVSEPKLLLLDEPNCGLTSSESADLIDKIGDLGPDIAVIMVSHDIDLVFGFSNRIIVLHHGQIIADGIPQKIKADPKVKEIYMGISEEKGIAEPT